MSGDSLPRRTFALLCTVVFSAVGGLGPTGLHDCPHHDVPSGPGGGHTRATDAMAAGHLAAAPDADAHAGEAHATEAHAGDAHTGDVSGADSHDSEGPCTCVGDCHASAATPVPLSSEHTASSRVLGEMSSDALDGRRGPLGPRHGLFELHLPNAPPASL